MKKKLFKLLPKIASNHSNDTSFWYITDKGPVDGYTGEDGLVPPWAKAVFDDNSDEVFDFMDLLCFLNDKGFKKLKAHYKKRAPFIDPKRSYCINYNSKEEWIKYYFWSKKNLALIDLVQGFDFVDGCYKSRSLIYLPQYFFTNENYIKCGDKKITDRKPELRVFDSAFHECSNKPLPGEPSYKSTNYLVKTGMLDENCFDLPDKYLKNIKKFKSKFRF